MSERTEPKRTITVCDICRCEKEGGRAPGWLHNGGFTVKRDALDGYNIPVADATVKRDLCDNCLDRVSAVVNAEAERIRGGMATILGTVRLDVVFDGPPAHESGRFVECEVDGKGVSAGKWVEDGEFWRLRLEVSPSIISKEQP